LSTATKAEIALRDENRELRARIAALESEVASGEAERRVLREVLRDAPVMVAIVRVPDCTYELVNAAFQSLAPEMHLTGCRVADVSAGPAPEILDKVLATGDPCHIADVPHTIRRGPDAPEERIHISYSLTPLFAPDGKPDRIVILGVDTTDAARRRARCRLETLSALADHSPDNLDWVDRDCRHVYVNAGAAAAVGCSPGEMVGKTNREIGIPDPWAGAFEDRVRQVLKTGQFLQVEDSFSTPEGLQFFDTRYVPEIGPDGAVASVLAVSHNITDRKQSEEKLLEAIRSAETRAREAEEGRRILDAIMEYIPEGIIVASAPDAITTMTSRYAIDLLFGGSGTAEGYSGEDWLASVEFYLADGVTPAGKEDFPLWRAVKHGEQVQGKEMTARKTNGDLFSALCNAGPIRDKQGNITGGVVAWTDITERKRVEEAIRKSEAMLARAQRVANMGSWEWNIATGELLWSEQIFRMFGLEQGFKPSYEAFLARLSPDNRERVKTAVAGALAGQPYVVEYTMDLPDSSVRHILSQGNVDFDETGKPIRMTGTAQDVTAANQAEQRLRELSQRLTYHVDNSPLAVIEWGPNMRLSRWSGEAERLFGWKAEEVLGKRMEDFRWIYTEDELQVAEVSADLQSGANPRRFSANRNYRKDGSVVHCEWYNSSLLDASGKLRSILSLVLDVTARKQAEAALRASEERLRLFVEHTPAAVAMLDREMRYLAVSRRWLTDYRLPQQDLVGLSHYEVFPEIPERWKEIHRRCLAGAVEQCQEDPFPRVDGNLDWVRWEIHPWRRANGEIGGIIMFTEQINERKRAEERLRQAQKLESLGLLAGGVAHDFNNLLVGVIGNASLAQDMLPQGHPAIDVLDEIIKTGENAAHLTRQMLAYAGKGRFVIEPVNLSKLIPDMKALVRPAITKNIALHLDLKPDLPAIEADPGQIQQIFMNLALNAAEAFSGGAGVISVSTGIRELDAGSINDELGGAEIRPGKYVYLEVLDNGCGMDEETKAKVFDPFFSTKFTGRGLGLAAVAGIVRGHKGAIKVESEPGRGSCFTVLLPVAESAAADRAATAPEPAIKGSGTVLVVDDEAAVREMARRSLEHFGFDVLMAGSGAEAIDVLKRHPGKIALVLLDLGMPKLSGEQVLPELRRIRPEVKVVVSSGYSETEAMKLFRGSEISGFLQKPYTATGLAEKVKSAME
jgi:PAS domain S-box-containing protein